MQKFKEYLIEDFIEELKKASILCGIAIGDTKLDAEKNKLAGFVAIEELLPFIKACNNLQNHILNPIIENIEGTEEEKKIQAVLPDIINPVKIEEKKEKEKERISKLKDYDDLDEESKQLMMKRFLKYYEKGDMDRLYLEPVILSQRFGIKITKEKIIELIQKKSMENIEENSAEEQQG